jgi:hypothetical protein
MSCAPHWMKLTSLIRQPAAFPLGTRGQ